MNAYFIAILLILVLKSILDITVELLDINHLKVSVPEEFKKFYDEKKYSRSQMYTREKAKFSIFRNGIMTALIMAFMVLGGFNYIDLLVRGIGFKPILTGLLYSLVLVLLIGITDLPFRIYSIFVIEEKYGFNRTKSMTFVFDLLKGFSLLILLGGPLLALVLWLFQETGEMAPLFIWIVVSFFQIFLTFCAPLIIMPLFNTFTPLGEGDLRDAIEKYAGARGFQMKGIYTIDGSKRSAKTNAFFTGIGKSRRIVFYDTLINKHAPDELVSILAHEMGHYKLGHVTKMMIISIMESGLLFSLLSFFIENPALFAAFKMNHRSIYASLIFFGFLYSPIATVLSLGMNRISRQFEYKADAFAVQTTGKGPTLVSVLQKLSADNLSNLTPHPLKVFVSYSHPPILKRIEAIRELSSES